LRVCLDLNIWCAELLARRAGRSDTACQRIVAAVRGLDPAAPLQLVISWGMLHRLQAVLQREFGFGPASAADLIEIIADYAEEGPSLTLGGVGVLPIHDAEDRHVLETAWAGAAEVLVTADFGGFLAADAEIVEAGRIARLCRGAATLWIVHPFSFARWLRGETVVGLEALAATDPRSGRR
jgi:predicted nucleic acid-binding protein